MIKYLSSIFDEIDVWNSGQITFDQFSNFIIQKSSILSNKVIYNKVDEIKPYNLNSKGIFIPKGSQGKYDSHNKIQTKGTQKQAYLEGIKI